MLSFLAVDIYDGETEPVVYHGKTLTSKVSVREICTAIANYAFVASTYPVIISAEVHCGVAQQDMLADMMKEIFKDSLVWAPPNGRPKIDVLPSPEQLKGKILLKVSLCGNCCTFCLSDLVCRRRICSCRIKTVYCRAWLLWRRSLHQPKLQRRLRSCKR